MSISMRPGRSGRAKLLHAITTSSKPQISISLTVTSCSSTPRFSTPAEHPQRRSWKHWRAVRTSCSISIGKARNSYGAARATCQCFYLPPSTSELEKRLRAGRRIPARSWQTACAAPNEMSHYPEYDYIIVNREVEKHELVAISRQNG